MNRLLFTYLCPGASERSVLPIVGVYKSLRFTPSHPHIFSFLIFTSSHLHISSSSHLLIFTSSHLLTFTDYHLHIFSSSHLLLTFSHLLILPSSPHLPTSFYFYIFSPHTFSSCPLLLSISLRREQGQWQRDGTKRNRNEVRSSKTEVKIAISCFR